MRSRQGHRNEEAKGRAKKEQGFTLLDVIAALALLTVGLLAVASMHVGAIQGNSFAGHVTEGVTWAQDKLEQLMALPYDDLNDDSSPEQQGLYTIAWTVSNGPVANTKLITVTVTWQDKGFTRQARLISLKPQV